MWFARAFTAAFLAFTTGIATAESLPKTAIPFLDASRDTRNTDIVISSEAAAALSNTEDPVTLSGVPLASGESATFVVEPAASPSSGPQFIAMNPDGTSTPLNIKPRRTWRGTDPQNSDRAIFISANLDGQLRSLVLGKPGTPATTILPTDSGSNTYAISTLSDGEAAICNAIPLPTTEQLAQANTARNEPTTATLLEIPIRLDVSHELYIALGRNDERVADYVTDIVGATNVIFRRDVQLHWDVQDVVIWKTRPAFELPHDEYYEAFGTSAAAMQQASESLHTGYALYIAGLPAAFKRSCHILMHTHAQMISRPYIGIAGGSGAGTNSSCLFVLKGVDDFDADGDSYFLDTWLFCHNLGHMCNAEHTNCYSPPIDCCTVGCGCTSITPTIGTIMSYCNYLAQNGGGMDMRFHPRVISESILPFLAAKQAEPFSRIVPHTTAPLMTVHGFKDTYIAPGSGETSGTTLRANPTSGPVEQIFTIRNLGTAPLLLTATPPVSLNGSDQFAIISQPTSSTLAPDQATTFALRFDPAGGPASAQVSIPANVAGVADYTFQVNGHILVPSEPFVITYAPGLTIPFDPEVALERRIVVSDIPGLITDIKVRIDGTDCSDPAKTGIQHSRVGELLIGLESPDGTFIWLMRNPGNSRGANFCNTILADDPTKPLIQDITQDDAPYTGTYRPLEPLAAFLGERPNGHWRIYLADNQSGRTGILHSISLIITGEDQAGVTEWPIYN